MNSSATPFRQFVIKVATRCDLACDHCYVYEHADRSWRTKPAYPSDETVVRIAERIAEHARLHALSSVEVVLHGGEPLLAGPDRLARTADVLAAALSGTSRLTIKIHTNGVLLDARFCDLFAAKGIKVGISLDGDRIANDRHRRYASGRSSYDKVIAAIDLLRTRYPQLYSGLLCTVDIANDPVAVYEALAALEPPRIDLLLPHATWDAPPSGATGAHGEWLVKVFDRWWSDGRPMAVRLFDSALRTLADRSSLTESLGLEPSDLVVIETDGSYEQADSLKTAYDGAPATGFDVRHHSLDEVAGHPGIRNRQIGLAGLAEECRACPVVSSCGGGLYAHRYRTGTGFDNPSVYCADLLRLVSHVRDTVEAVEHTTHALPPTEFDALAAGYGARRAVLRLEEAQQSLRRTLLAEAGAESAESAESDAWRLLTRLDQEARPALDRVLAHPYVRVWAVRCLADRSHAGHLASIAAATAITAGARASIGVPLSSEALHLPSLGRLDLPGRTEVEIEVDGRGFSVHDGARRLVVDLDRPERTPEWWPVRRVAMDGWTVAVDDVDLYRDCHQWPASGRLSGAEFGRWTAMLGDAWRLIVNDHRDYAPGLAAGLGVVVPLRPASDGSETSSTARDAFGAVAAALPSGAVSLALLLIHEFQHVKLGAILDIHPLFDPKDANLYYAPWRPDPRPLEGLLQGTYAHLAVTDFWRVRRLVDHGVDAHTAAVRFARWRTLTAEAVETLSRSGGLTEIGTRFVGRMRETVRPWLAEQVPAAAEREAQEAAAAHRRAWRAAAPDVAPQL
ncbi:hypothetical protein Sru01_17270 [Sphaerisporangium rufum]|uniref:Radical SAM core domain-containing protein n=1 Tax=Sphaerisporangium rufum TaxID=1381558 RepID=A0A919R427_9ACTN|nr:FxsB family cyclophane-forming radical SAM/SPASM peptide maturase [Sphaerisporangium rufum]GII76745.1 hypothetical protein Sru01_17270 [Sphaerisporangium rufum]